MQMLDATAISFALAIIAVFPHCHILFSHHCPLYPAVAQLLTTFVFTTIPSAVTTAVRPHSPLSICFWLLLHAAAHHFSWMTTYVILSSPFLYAAKLIHQSESLNMDH